MVETPVFLHLRHSNHTICGLLSLFCSKNFHLFPFLYWDVQFLITPEWGGEEATGAGNGKRIRAKWLRHRLFCTWGIQTRPFVAYYAYFVLNIFIFLHFYTGMSNSLLPQSEEERKQQGLEMGKGFAQNGWDTGFSALGAFKLDHL